MSHYYGVEQQAAEPEVMLKLVMEYRLSLKPTFILFLLLIHQSGAEGGFTFPPDNTILPTLQKTLNLQDWTNDTDYLDPCNVSPDRQPDWYSCVDPASISAVNTRATRLWIINTTYAGVLPPDIGQLVSLQILYIENNPFVPDRPPVFTDLKKILEIRLINSNFTNVDLSSFIAELPPTANEITLDSNPWTKDGSLPAVSQNLTRLSLQNCNIEDRASSISSNLQANSLSYLYLDGNRLTGDIGDMSIFENLSELSLRNCQLTSIDSSVFQLPTLQKLYLDNNEKIFIQAGNKFPAIDLSPSNFTTLHMANCGLVGPIDPTMYLLENLQDLRLTSNQLSGTLASLPVLKNLRYLDLSENNFSSFVGLEQLPQDLKILNLSHNNFTGPIPDFLGDLPNLQVLDLTGNRFDHIPPTLVERSKRGNLLLKVDPYLLDITNGTIINSEKSKKKQNDIIIAVVATGSAVLVISIVCVLTRIWIKNCGLLAQTVYVPVNLEEYKKNVHEDRVNDRLYRLFASESRQDAAVDSESTKVAPEIDIVLFHGPARDEKNSKDIYWQDWMTDKGEFFPHLLNQDFQCRIHAVAYDSGLLSEKDMDLVVLAEVLEQDIVRGAEIGATLPVVLIGHSTGGIIINYFLERLIKYHTDRLSSHHVEADAFLKQLKGVYYFSAPLGGLNVGALHASLGVETGRETRPDPFIQDINELSTELSRVNEYIQKWHNDSSHVLFGGVWEGPQGNVVLRTWQRLCCAGQSSADFQIIKEASVRPAWIQHIYTARDANHFTTCKLSERTSSTYEHLVQLIEKCTGIKRRQKPSGSIEKYKDVGKKFADNHDDSGVSPLFQSQASS